MRCFIFCAAGLAALVAATPVFAVTLYWDGTGTSWNVASNWSTASNATTPNPAAVPGAADVANFNITTVNTVQVVNLDAAQAAQGLVFTTTGTVLIQSGAGSNTLSLGTSGISGLNSGAVTISTALSLTGNQNWSNQSVNPFTISGNVANGGNALTVVNSGSGGINISGSISGSGSVGINGGTTLTLSGNNSFTGPVSIGVGFIQLGNAGALNSVTPVAVTYTAAANGALRLTGNSVTISGLTTNATPGTPSVQNANAAPATLTVNNTTVDTFAGTLQDGAGGGALSLAKSGAGTLILSGANTFTGGTTVNAGTLTLSGTHPSTGSVTINGGTLQIGNFDVFNSVTPNVVNFGPASTGIFKLNGKPTFVGGLNSDAIVGTPIVQNGQVAPATLVVVSSTNSTFAGTLQDGAGGGALTLNKRGAGTLTLSGNNALTGGFVVEAGTLVLSGNTGSPGGLSISGGNVQLGSTTALSSASSVVFPTTSTGTLSLNGYSATIAGLSSTVGPAVQNANAAPATLIVNFAGSNTYAGNLIDGVGGGALSLTKTGAGTLTLSGNNSMTGNLTIDAGGVTMSGGSLNATVINNSSFVYNSGAFNGRLVNASPNLTLNADFTAGNGLENDVNYSVPAGRTIILGGLGLNNVGTLTTGGGTLLLSTAVNAANVNRGTFNLSATTPFNLNGATLTNNGTLNLNGGLLNGASGLLSNGPGGVVAGSGTIASPFNNAGGVVVVGSGTTNITQTFSNTGLIQLTAFTSNLAGGAITSSGAIEGIGTVGNIITNTGTIEAIGGTLTLAGTVTNNTPGRVLAPSGSKVLFTGTVANNSGNINLTGGTVQFAQAMTNSASGAISGRGTLIVGGAGLTNIGSVGFSGGATDVFGKLNNSTGIGTKGVTISGNAAVTFWDDVTNGAGSLFKVSAGSSATFFGTYAGDVASGTGQVNFESDITPGFSPASINFGGNVALSSTATLNIELGGTSPGAGYDQLLVTGQLSLGGTLTVSMINSFTPTSGQEFNILDWGSLSGTFSSLNLPTLTGLVWNTSALYTSGVLSVASPGVPGDYNNNGTVDAPDYVLWRKNNNTATTLPNDATAGTDPSDYDVWRGPIGQPPGSGSGATANTAVPEPTTFGLLTLAAAGWSLRRRRTT